MQKELLTDEQLIQKTKLIKGFKNLAGYAVTPNGDVYSLASQCWIKPMTPSGEKRYYVLRGESYAAARLVAYAYLDVPEELSNTYELSKYDVKFKNGDTNDVHPDNLVWDGSRSTKGLTKTKFDRDAVYKIKQRYCELLDKKLTENSILDELRKEFSTNGHNNSRSFFKGLIQGNKRPYRNYANMIPYDGIGLGMKIYVSNPKLRTYNQEGMVVKYSPLQDRVSVHLDTGTVITTRTKNVRPVSEKVHVTGNNAVAGTTVTVDDTDPNQCSSANYDSNVTEVTYKKNSSSDVVSGWKKVLNKLFG